MIKEKNPSSIIDDKLLNFVREFKAMNGTHPLPNVLSDAEIIFIKSELDRLYRLIKEREPYGE